MYIIKNLLTTIYSFCITYFFVPINQLFLLHFPSPFLASSNYQSILYIQEMCFSSSQIRVKTCCFSFCAWLISPNIMTSGFISGD